MSIRGRLKRLEKQLGDEEERYILAIIDAEAGATPEEIEAITEEQARAQPGDMAIVLVGQKEVDAFRQRHGVK